MPTIKQEHTPSYTAAQMEQVRAEFQVAVSQRNDLLEQRDDLLAACERMVEWYGAPTPDDDEVPALAAARAAIAKARG